MQVGLVVVQSNERGQTRDGCYVSGRQAGDMHTVLSEALLVLVLGAVLAVEAKRRHPGGAHVLSRGVRVRPVLRSRSCSRRAI